MEQWIQYVLDTCATVEEVVKSAQAINLDGWNWHFYAVDRTGRSAVIEFFNGKPSFRMGASLPLPILCNSVYDEELERLNSYQGYGGKQDVELDNPEEHRFVQGVHLLDTYEVDEDPVAYGFMILDTMSRGNTKWAKMRVTFRTNVNPRLRYVDLDSFDYSCKTPRLILDVHAELFGDVRSSFTEYTEDTHCSQVEKTIALLAELPEFETILKSMGGTRDGMTKRFSDHPGTTSCD